MLVLLACGILVCKGVQSSSVKYQTSSCSQNGSTDDCQIWTSMSSVLPSHTCQVHPTAACASQRQETLFPTQRFSKGSQADFLVSIHPYSLNRSGYYSSTAINVTLETWSPEVAGFLLSLQQPQTLYNSCRLFDFKEARRLQPTANVSINYDCFIGFNSGGGFRNYHLLVRSLPMLQELAYQMVLPQPSCLWSSVLLVNSAGLLRNALELSFSPPTFSSKAEGGHPLTYSFQLHSSQMGVASLFLNSSSPTGWRNKGTMIHLRLEDVPSGSYNLSVAASNQSLECPLYHLLPLTITSQEHDRHHWVFAVIILGALVAVVFLGFIVYRLCHRLESTDTKLQAPSKPKVVLLYSNDCPEHREVCVRFETYLNKCCNVSATLIDDKNMERSIGYWIPEQLAEAQMVAVIGSKGVYHKVEKNNSPPLEELPSGDLFLPSLNLLMRKVLEGSRQSSHLLTVNPPGQPQEERRDVEKEPCQVLKVFFEYTSRRHMPRCLQDIGQPFPLMAHFNQFLCQLHCQASRSFPIKIYPKMPGSELLAHSEGKELLQALEEMKQVEKHNPGWFQAALSRGGDSDPEEGGEGIPLKSQQPRSSLSNQEL